MNDEQSFFEYESDDDEVFEAEDIEAQLVIKYTPKQTLTYTEMKNVFEKEWFFNNYNCRFYRMLDDGELKHYTLNDTKTYCRNMQVKTEEEEYPFFDAWIKDKEQRRYEKVVFNPDPSFKSDKYFNTWKGWKWLDNQMVIDDKSIECFIDVIDYLTNSNEQDKVFILDWLSWIIQKPWRKTNVALSFYSRIQGVGKNSFIELCLRLFEGYTAKLKSIEDINKQFNAHFQHKIFVYGDEIKANAKDLSDALKNVITETEKSTERKGIDAEMGKDYSNYALTTNHEKPFQVEDSDRRFQMNETLGGRRDYTEFYDKLKDDSLIKMFFNYLHRRDNSHIKILIPTMNDYKKRLINQTLPAYIQYLYDCYEFLGETSAITLEELFQNIKSYAKTKHLTCNFTKNIMSRVLNEKYKEISTKGRNRKDGITYTFKDASTLLTYFKKENPIYFCEE